MQQIQTEEETETYSEKETKARRTATATPPKTIKGRIWCGGARERSGGGSAVTVTTGTAADILLSIYHETTTGAPLVVDIARGRVRVPRDRETAGASAMAISLCGGSRGKGEVALPLCTYLRGVFPKARSGRVRQSPASFLTSLHSMRLPVSSARPPSGVLGPGGAAI